MCFIAPHEVFFILPVAHDRSYFNGYVHLFVVFVWRNLTTRFQCGKYCSIQILSLNKMDLNLNDNHYERIFETQNFL